MLTAIPGKGADNLPILFWLDVTLSLAHSSLMVIYLVAKSALRGLRRPKYKRKDLYVDSHY